MINVGSMRGACAVGGRNGVAVDAGEQLERKTRINTTATKHGLGTTRVGWTIIKKGDPAGRPDWALDLCFFVEGGNTAAVRFDSHIKRESDLAA